MPGRNGFYSLSRARAFRFAAGLSGFLFGALPTLLLADVIHLKDGSQYEGDIKKTDDGWWVTLAGGKKILVAADKVTGLEARPKVGDGVPDQRLASLRRAVEAIPDIKQILERYRAFTLQYPNTPASELAAGDLKLWQDRLDRKLVKVGDKWVTDDEKKQLIEQSAKVAEQANDLLRQGRVNEAMPILDQALIDNPQNAAALYLRGILLWKQDKIPEARKALDAASALLPDHAATYNNLAIVQWRQNQQVAALLTYDKALIAAPLHRTILDNMAEALHVLPEELRGGAAVKKVVRHFNDQELLLQQQMAAQGLYRWGANWVNKTDFENLRAAEKEVRVKLEKLEGDYVALGQRITRLSDDIASAERTLARMESDSIAYDASGRIIRVPLPRSYYDFVRDVSSMKAERTQRREEQETLRRQGMQLAQSLPIPQYNGIQRFIEWEGTPIFGNNAARKPDVANGVPADPLAGHGGAQKPVNLAANSPAATQPAVATQPGPSEPPAIPPPPRPRPMVPIERPSILDRAFSDDFPRANPSTQPLLDSNGK